MSVPNLEAWGCGAPAVASSLYLVGKAKKNRALLQLSEESISIPWMQAGQERRLINPSYGYGVAGSLAIAAQMAKETGSALLKEKTEELEQAVKNSFNVTHLFGFQAMNFSGDDVLFIDNASLLHGASGIALSLLNLHKQIDPSYNRIFMIG